MAPYGRPVRQPDASSTAPAKLLHVQEGTLTLAVDGDPHTLRAGTAGSFEAHVPHGYRNDGAAPVRMTMAVAVPPPA